MRRSLSMVLATASLLTVRAQAQHVLVSANRHLDDYAALCVDVVRDALPEYPGPLAGIAALLAATPCDLLATVPVDARDIPPDFVARLQAARGEEAFALVVAEDDDGLQPHEANINRLAAAGIVHGFADGTFGPNVPVNRAQMATFIDNAQAFLTGTAKRLLLFLFQFRG